MALHTAPGSAGIFFARRPSPVRPADVPQPATAAAAVLLVDGDAPSRDAMAAGFRADGYGIVTADSVAAARSLLHGQRVALAVVDECAGGADALALGASIRRDHDIPVLFLGSPAGRTDVVQALDAGIDDFLRHPFGTRELVARGKAVLRRASARPIIPATTAIGRMTLDTSRRELRAADGVLRLTPIECRLLALLVQHAGRVLPHDRLLHLVWGAAHVGDHHMLHVNMCRLRHKLQRLGDTGMALRTVPGTGYALEPVAR
jgi:DNA-binding response OmpR family regulator